MKVVSVAKARCPQTDTKLLALQDHATIKPTQVVSVAKARYLKTRRKLVSVATARYSSLQQRRGLLIIERGPQGQIKTGQEAKLYPSASQIFLRKRTLFKRNPKTCVS